MFKKISLVLAILVVAARPLGGAGAADMSGGGQSGFGGTSAGMARGGFAAQGGTIGRAGGVMGHSGHIKVSGTSAMHIHRIGGTAGSGATSAGAPTAHGGKVLIVTGTGPVGRAHFVPHPSVFSDFRRHHRHGLFHHHAVPFIFFGGAIPVVTGSFPVAAESEAIETGASDFAVTNDTDSEMTVSDNGVRLCVLAPKARCSFAAGAGHHDISVTISGRESSDASFARGRLIEVGK